jgi:hypothetical protein
MDVAMMQLSEPTRVLLGAVNLGGLYPSLTRSDLFATTLFLGLAALLWFVATGRVLAPPAGGAGRD